MKLYFTRSKGIVSKLIRAYEGSNASHVGIAHKDGVMEASFSKGVRLVSMERFFQDKELVHTAEFSVPNEEEAVWFLSVQRGKPYDFTALMGFMLWRDWSARESWYCSELACAAALAGGKTLADRHPRFGVRMMMEVAHAWGLKGQS